MQDVQRKGVMSQNREVCVVGVATSLLRVPEAAHGYAGGRSPAGDVSRLAPAEAEASEAAGVPLIASRMAAFSPSDESSESELQEGRDGRVGSGACSRLQLCGAVLTGSQLTVRCRRGRLGSCGAPAWRHAPPAARRASAPPAASAGTRRAWRAPARKGCPRAASRGRLQGGKEQWRREVRRRGASTRAWWQAGRRCGEVAHRNKQASQPGGTS